MTTIILPGTNPPDQGFKRLSIPAKYAGLLPITQVESAPENSGVNATLEYAFRMSLSPMQLLWELNGTYLTTPIPGGNLNGVNWYNPFVAAELLADAVAEGSMYEFLGKSFDAFTYMNLETRNGNAWQWDAQHQGNFNPNQPNTGPMPAGALPLSTNPADFKPFVAVPPIPSPSTTCPIGRLSFPMGAANGVGDIYAHLAGDSSKPGQVWPATGTDTAKGVGARGSDVTGQWQCISFGQSDLAQLDQIATAWKKIA